MVIDLNRLTSRILYGLLVFLAASAVYLYGWPQANVLYAAVVFFHVLAGAATSIILLFKLASLLRASSWIARAGWILTLLGAATGCWLIKTGTLRAEWRAYDFHIGLAVTGAALLAAQFLSTRWKNTGRLAPAIGLLVIAASVAAITLISRYTRETQWKQQGRIENPEMAASTMDGEGDGPHGAFFPSSAQVEGGGRIPSEYFMESGACKRCHEDIYNQWNSSAHHFSSFNNQWYRSSIEYMQDVVGTQPSKWCGGCHDPAVLYSGKMDTPIKQIVHTPEAQAGLGCMMCHSISRVKSTMGQADFYLSYPKLHELAASNNPIVRGLHDLLVKLNPEPHRRVFLKPFMREQTAEFCSSCHKVHLDVPVNHYRWFRGFNEYDNWQASGVSGQGARSFYYPPKSSQCADCHMPQTKSADMGNVNGFVHSHRFPGANTALPIANEDESQLAATEKFLQDKNLTVDIFAMSRQEKEPTPKVAAGQADIATTFAVGEEAEAKITPAADNEPVSVFAPLNRVQPPLRRGETVRVDVVVRTKKVGHFFPGGTVDAYDTWLELKAVDDKQKTVFWSGMAADNGKGPVDKGAHFYRSLQIDAHGNPINKRNAWATRAVVYVRLIPPGAADTVHYRLNIPKDVGSHLTLHARLCYRKFAWWSTQFAFAGEAQKGQEDKLAQDYDDRAYDLKASLKGVSAKREAIPDLPIVTVAENEVTLPIMGSAAKPETPKADLQKDDWQRWNDYGIGLFLQGDLRSAAAAFRKVTEIDDKNPEGWVNLGRCAVQEGDMARARTVLEKAIGINPKLAKAHYFYARALRSEGNYAGAAEELQKVLAQYPRDRVALNDLGRVLFLQRKFGDAVVTLKRVLEIDPEDLQAHYNLMLCYKGLGDETLAKEHEARYLRFKADESAQAITGPYRQIHAEDNNERQAVHEHSSALVSNIGPVKKAAGRKSAPIPQPASASGGTQ